MIEDHKDLVGREFRHFKGNLYRLEGFAKDSETLEEMVVYRALYMHPRVGVGFPDEQSEEISRSENRKRVREGGLWVRPAKMFFETIERDGEAKDPEKHPALRPVIMKLETTDEESKIDYEPVER